MVLLYVAMELNALQVPQCHTLGDCQVGVIVQKFLSTLSHNE